MSTVLPSIVTPMRLPSIKELTNSTSASDSNITKFNLPSIHKSQSPPESSSNKPQFKAPSSTSSTSSLITPSSSSSSNYVTTKPPASVSFNPDQTPINSQPALPSLPLSASTSPVSNYQYQQPPNYHSPIINTQVHAQVHSQQHPPPPHYVPQYYAQPIYYHPHHVLPPGAIIAHHSHPHIPHYQIPAPEIINKPSNKCHRCGTTETPEWRRGPKGVRTLCNACGLYHAKLVKRKGAALAAEEVLNNRVTKGKNGRRISLKKHLLNESLKTQQPQSPPHPQSQPQSQPHSPPTSIQHSSLPSIDNKNISLLPPIKQYPPTTCIPQLPIVRQ